MWGIKSKRQPKQKRQMRRIKLRTESFHRKRVDNMDGTRMQKRERQQEAGIEYLVHP
jgi:hypothetical protein